MKDMILKGLNPQQKSAVEYLDSPLFVSAGAGNGKTKVLTHKLAYLVKEKGLRPHRILAITFTKKAASEMAGCAEKIRELSPNHAYSDMAILIRMTFLSRAKERLYLSSAGSRMKFGQTSFMVKSRYLHEIKHHL